MIQPRRAIALAAVASAAACLMTAACRSRRGPSRAVLRRPLAVEPAILPAMDPSDGYARFVSGFVYQGLTSVDATSGVVTNRLAQELTRSADGRQVRATVRGGVRFHDGSELGVADVVASFRYVLEPGGPAGRLRSELGGLVDVQPAGARTIVFTWPRSWFRAEASLSLVPIVPARSVAAGVAAWAKSPPPGTGPFAIERWRHRERIDLVRVNAGLGARPHTEGRPVEGISFPIVPDPSSQLRAFQAGELDLVNVDVGTFVANRSALEQDTRWRVFTYSSSRAEVLFFNNREGAFRDAAMRAAAASAIDRAAMARAFSGGLNRPMRGPVLPAGDGLGGFGPPRPFVPGQARAQLAALPASVSHRPVVLRAVAGGPELRQVVEAIRAQLAEAGLEVRVESSDFTRLLTDVHDGRFDLVLLQVAVGADEDPWDSWHSLGGANFARYGNKEVDELLERARSVPDSAARAELYARASTIIDEDHAAVFLWRLPVVTLVAARLQGAEPPHTFVDDVIQWRLLSTTELEGRR